MAQLNINTAMANVMLENDTTNETASVASSTTAQLSLLGLPLELRHKIYRYSLKIDRSASHRAGLYEDIVSDRLLQVSRQIRAEAWDYLVRSNQLIKVTVVGKNDVDDLRPGDFLDEYIPTDLFSPADTAVLSAQSVFRIKLGPHVVSNAAQESSADRVESGFYAYSFDMHTNRFCTRARHHVPKYQELHISVRSDLRAAPQMIVHDVLIPLAQVRGLQKAQIEGCQTVKIYQRLEAAMQKTYTSFYDFQEHFAGLADEIRDRITALDLATATCLLSMAEAMMTECTLIAEQRSWNWNSPGATGVQFLTTEIMIAQLRVHDFMLKVHAINPLATARQFLDYADLSLSHTEIIFLWPGISDAQRGQTHRYKGNILKTIGGWINKSTANLELFRATSYQSSALANLATGDATQIFETAAHQYVYAVVADRMAANLCGPALGAICKAIGKSLEEVTPPLVQVDLPSQDMKWEGDPELLDIWRDQSGSEIAAGDDQTIARVVSQKELKDLEEEISAGHGQDGKSLSDTVEEKSGLRISKETKVMLADLEATIGKDKCIKSRGMLRFLV